MKKSIQLIIIFVLLFVSVSVEAHNPDEISYFYEIHQNRGELKIHLTPKGAIDLLREIHPKLQSQTVIQLDDYLLDFTSYFNEHIKLKLNSQLVRLKFLKAELNAHDATILFELEQIPEAINTYDITLSSFTEIYCRIDNIVFFDINDHHDICYLNKETQHYRVEIQSNDSPSIHQENNSNYLWLLALFPVIGAAGWAFQRRH